MAKQWHILKLGASTSKNSAQIDGVKWLVAILLPFLACNSFGQEPYLRNYRVKDGLPSNNVYQVIQDQNGIICLSTDEGIAQFDGYSFKTITAQQGLPDDEIFSIRESDSGEKWFVTQNGKLGYQDSLKEFHVIEPNANYPNYYTISRSIAISDNGTVYFTKNHALYKYENKQIDKLMDDLFIDLVWTFNNEIFVALGNSIISYPSLDTVTNLPFSGKVSTRISYLDQNHIALTEALKCVIISSKGEITQELSAPIESGEIISCFSPNKNEFWLGTRNGVLVIEKSTNQLKSSFLKGLSISSMTSDHEGNYWISSLEKGLFFWPNSLIKRIDCFSNKSPAIHALCAHNSKLWIGLDNGQYASIDANLKTQNCTEFTLVERSNEPVMKFRPLGQELFTVSKVLTKKHGQNKQKLNFYLNDIAKIGNKWLLISNPVSILNNESFNILVSEHAIIEERNKIIQSNPILEEYGLCALVAKDSTLWIGSQNGLYHFNGTTKKAEPFLTNSIKSGVHYMGFLPNQDLVIASSQNGILLIRDKKIIDQFNQEDGLAAGKAKAFFIDDKGNIWLSISNQLFQIAQDSKTISNYSLKLGLDLETIICIYVLNDILLIGTDHGLFQYNLNTLSAQNTHLKLGDLNMRVKGKNWSWKTNHSLPSNANQIAFEYQSLSYLYQGRLSYRYRLLGLDTVWNSTSSQRIEYEPLQAGKYTWQIQAQAGTIAASDIEEISFEISVPYYQKYWFIIGIIIIFLLIIYLIYYLRLRSVRAKHSLEKSKLEAQRQKEETEKKLAILSEQALRSQMNPHFIFNALNTIKGYYAEGRKDLAQGYIVKFSKLLRIILENSHANISLSKEIELLKIYLELLELRYDHSFSFSIESIGDLDPEQIYLPSMLLQPFVENAVIHGLMPKNKKGKLQIKFQVKNNNLIVSIEDDGVGRSFHGKKIKESNHKSLATQLTKQRLSLLDMLNETEAQLEIIDLTENNKATGTRVILKIPFSHEY